MRKGDATRERIVAAAAPIFNQHGYEGTSMQQLMEATGLEKGGIYRHFSGKEELAREAFLFSLREIRRLRVGDVENIRGSMAKLRYIIQRFVEVPSPIAGGCPLMNTAIDADDGNPILRELAAKALRGWQSGLAEIAAEGVRLGDIRSTADSRRIANTIISTLEGALMLSRIESNRKPLADARASLEEWLDGLQTDSD